MTELQWIASHRPVIAHNIGLSLAGTTPLDEQYVAKLVEWHTRFGFRWHSDHLSFVDVASAHGLDHNTGLAVPMPYDHEVLDLVARRIEDVQRAIPAAFLIENNVSFIDFPDQEMSEPEFLNRLAARTGCGLLLDVHNVYANSRNHGFDARGIVDAIELDRVIEIHIAGGTGSTACGSIRMPEPVPSPCSSCSTTSPRRLRICVRSPSSSTSRTSPSSARTDCASNSSEHELRGRGAPGRSVTLAAFQRALSDLVASPVLVRRVWDEPDSALAGYELTARERARLEAVHISPGWRRAAPSTA